MAEHETHELTLSGIDSMAKEFLTGGPGQFTKDFNRNLIETFRATEGRLNGELAGAPILLLTMIGAKSGKERTVPLVYIVAEGRIFIAASIGGADVNPVWYNNLLANPMVTVERKAEKYRAEAAPLEGAERDRIFEIAKSRTRQFAEYEQRTSRKIPVIELRRLD